MNALISGHPELSDWLFLIAAILLALATVVSFVEAPVGRSPGRYLRPGVLAAGCLVAVAWLVL